MTKQAAVLDANVLIPENLGSFLATCAYTGCFTPVLSTLALDEVIRNFPIAKKRMRKMESAFAEYFVTPNPQLIASINLSKSPEDAHIVAAAITSSANVIVTNDSDLILEVNERTDLEFVALYPFEFLLSTIQQDSEKVCEAVKLTAQMRKKPNQWTTAQVIESLVDIGRPSNQEFIKYLTSVLAKDSS